MMKTFLCNLVPHSKNMQVFNHKRDDHEEKYYPISNKTPIIYHYHKTCKSNKITSKLFFQINNSTCDAFITLRYYIPSQNPKPSPNIISNNQNLT